MLTAACSVASMRCIRWTVGNTQPINSRHTASISIIRRLLYVGFTTQGLGQEGLDSVLYLIIASHLLFVQRRIENWSPLWYMCNACCHVILNWRPAARSLYSTLRYAFSSATECWDSDIQLSPHAAVAFAISADRTHGDWLSENRRG